MSSHQTTVMDIRTNSFCSSDMHFPNGSYITLGGNGAVGRGRGLGSQLNPGGYSAAWDSEYQDFDGTKAIRILSPCTDAQDFSSTSCGWFDDPTVLSMQHSRWYSAAEARGDESVIIIGGFVSILYPKVARQIPHTNIFLQMVLLRKHFNFWFKPQVSTLMFTLY